MKRSEKEGESGSYNFTPIGYVHSCYKEKFGIPRQSGLVPAARATLELVSPYNRYEAIAELEGFSHIWVIFIFHNAIQKQWRPTVRPPRLGGNRRIGVFASRSPFRPNPVGLSAVKLEKIVHEKNRCLLHIQGADLLDGTPVLDIKPYLPYADELPEAVGGYAAEHPSTNLSINFSELAESQCVKYEQNGTTGLRKLIKEVLSQDPRPAYYADGKGINKKNDAGENKTTAKQHYGMRLYNFDLVWTVEADSVDVVELKPVSFNQE